MVPDYWWCMKASHLLVVCVVLITVSIFVIPGTIYLGIGKNVITDLSSLFLVAGILSAVLTVRQDAREGRERDRDDGR